MDLDRLRTFQVLAQTLHFRRAAHQLHRSQSAVSQQIRALETELGVLLVERIGRRTFLTPAGRVLSDEAAKVFAAIDRATSTVRAFGAGDAGAVRLGASTTPGVYIVPAALGAFRTAWPHVELEFRISSSAAIADALVLNTLDLGIVGEDITHDELFHEVIADDEIIAVAAPGVAPRPRLRATDVKSLPVLARESGSATRRHVDRALAQLGIEPQVAFELPSPEAQLRAAAAGLGLAFVSRRVAADELAAHRLVHVPITGVRIVRKITAAYHRDKRVTPAMHHLIGLLRRHARPTPRR
jgi:DNA-binding transcriptional LysR family regulator